MDINMAVNRKRKQQLGRMLAMAVAFIVTVTSFSLQPLKVQAALTEAQVKQYVHIDKVTWSDKTGNSATFVVEFSLTKEAIAAGITIGEIYGSKIPFTAPDGTAAIMTPMIGGDTEEITNADGSRTYRWSGRLYWMNADSLASNARTEINNAFPLAKETALTAINGTDDEEKKSTMADKANTILNKLDDAETNMTQNWETNDMEYHTDEAKQNLDDANQELDKLKQYVHDNFPSASELLNNVDEKTQTAKDQIDKAIEAVNSVAAELPQENDTLHIGVSVFNGEQEVLVGSLSVKKGQTVTGDEGSETNVITGVVLSRTKFMYDGKSHYPKVSKVTGTPEDPSIFQWDLDLPEKAVEPGVYTVTVTGVDGFTGPVSATYEIVKCNHVGTGRKVEKDYDWYEIYCLQCDELLGEAGYHEKRDGKDYYDYRYKNAQGKWDNGEPLVFPGKEAVKQFQIDLLHEYFKENPDAKLVVDGVEIPKDKINSWSGSTIIEFSQDYADSLGVGDHVFEIMLSPEDAEIQECVFIPFTIVPATCTVSFDTKGGTQIANQVVDYNTTAVRPADPTREYHTFVDWYADEAYTTLFDFGAPITADTTVYAKWNFDVEVIPANASETTTEAARVVSAMLEKILAGEQVEGMDAELVDKLKNAVQTGKEIKVEVTAPKVTEAQVKADVDKIKQSISQETILLDYYDVNTNVLIDGAVVGKVTKLAEKIKLQFDLPANLPPVPAGYTRIFKVFQIHEGVVKELKTKIVGDKGECEVDEFSTYVLASEDVKDDDDDDDDDDIVAAVTTTAATDAQTVVKSPKTGGEVPYSLWLAVSSLGMAGAALFVARRREQD